MLGIELLREYIDEKSDKNEQIQSKSLNPVYECEDFILWKKRKEREILKKFQSHFHDLSGSGILFSSCAITIFNELVEVFTEEVNDEWRKVDRVIKEYLKANNLESIDNDNSIDDTGKEIINNAIEEKKALLSYIKSCAKECFEVIHKR